MTRNIQTRPRAERSWYIEEAGVRTDYVTWPEALAAWAAVKNGYLCRNDGVLLDCRVQPATSGAHKT